MNNGFNDAFIPGYTGCLTGEKYHVGERNAVTKRRALLELQNKPYEHCPTFNECQKAQMTKIKNTIVEQHLQTPLTRVTDQPPKCDPKMKEERCSSWGSEGAGLFAGRSIAGYTGFIPQTKNFMGMQYSVVAKKALSKFNRQMSSWREHRAKPVDLKRNYEEDIPTVSIYHADTGMLPHYAGHVQGKLSMYGKSSTAITKEAILKSKEAKMVK